MEASPAKIIHYFNGEKQNIIPLFQRPYTWNQSNWQTLWDDVLVQYELDTNNTHFMGAIVSVPARSVPVGVSKFLIIDGQQRLTTFSLLLCALRDSLDKNSAARIQEVYLTNRFRDIDDTLKFVPTQADRTTYKNIAADQALPSTDKSLMAEAYRFFIKQLTSATDSDGNLIDASKVLTTLEHNLQVVMINLGDSDDPYLIFESLNFKGAPLTQADLVRNYLLMRFRHSITPGGEQEHIYKSYWRPLEELLSEHLTDFLRHYSMKNGDDIKQGSIYAAIKNKIDKIDLPQLVEDEISNLLKFGKYYAKILLLTSEQNLEIRRILKNIKDLKITTSYPLLLQLFALREEEKLSNENLSKCLHLIESYVVRRAVCGLPANSLGRLFLQLARDLPSTEQENWIRESMSNLQGGRRFPNDEEFSEAFKNQAQYGKTSTRYILERLETSFNHHETVDLSTITIEHVLPQTITPEWRNELGEDADKIHEKTLHTFGNLTLTGYNSELGNISFSEKIELLSNTHIELNRSILSKTCWGEIEIKDRAAYLLNISLEIWSFPSTNQ